MYHLKYSFLLVIWATIASQESFVKADGHVNLTAVTWAHAVNNKQLLNKTLFDADINMIEADVVLGSLVGDEKKTIVPIMAHPPAVTSDLSLEDFLSQVDASNTKNPDTAKGVKLDFKTNDAFAQSVTILLKYIAASYPVLLNADILKGPGDSSADPVDATKFLTDAKQFPKWALSLGWTTSASKDGAKYTDDQIKAMTGLIESNKIDANQTQITFAVRALYAAESVDQLKNLTDSVSRSTVTIWSPDEDDGKVDIDHLRELVKTVGLEKTYIDVPENISAKLSLDTLFNGSSMNRVLSPMYVLSLIMVLYNAINRI